MSSEELFLDYNAKAPAPLDPAIANTYLRLSSNRFIDGFDVEVSAFFGKEHIILIGDDLELSVRMSLNRSSLELHFNNCEAALYESNIVDGNREWTITQKKTISEARSGSNTGNIDLGGNVEVSSDTNKGAAKLSGTAGVGFENSNDTKLSLQAERSTGNWSLNSNTGILIGTLNQPLSGTEVDQFKGWRVKPNPTAETLAVVATLSTRSEWINFEDINDATLQGRIGRRTKNLFRSENRQRLELFKLLLKTLAAKGLSNSENSRNATLAIAVQVLRSNSGLDSVFDPVAIALENQSPLREINVDSQTIDRFHDLKNGSEVGFLLAQGISKEQIATVTTQFPSERKSKRGIFTAGSTPIRALQALEQLEAANGRLHLEQWKNLNLGRVRTDLINLGLARLNKGYVELIVEFQLDAETTLRHVAPKAPLLQTARSVLIENPAASAEEIISAVSQSHQKYYNSTASRTRVGNALRRWVFWLEPNLIDQEGGSKSEMFRLGALAEHSKHGHETLATPEKIELIQGMLDAGLGRVKAAEAAGGVHVNTIRLWISKGLLSDPND